jgi:type I restriction enzyme M protein
MHKTPAKPLYGLFEVNGAVIEYQADSELRDNENVALDPTQTVNDINEAYFIKEVLPHVADAWIDESKRDDKDGEIGIVGYEIPFNRHFYQYQPPRDLAQIDADLDAVSAEIMALLQEVHS